MRSLCRDCFTGFDAPGRCPACRSPRVITHDELYQLGVAHIDCDSFFAAVEKRDDPSLADKPVIIGGGRRGVVSTACYIARIHGVRSAMPMFKALAACPDAVVIRPRMAVYAAVGREIRDLMLAVTPLVEPLSIDEAFLDLRGTERLHHGAPAATLARLVARIEREVGVTASIGLSHNKFLAKIASDLDKPRGFSVIGAAETMDFLAPRPVSTIWGVGTAMQAKLKGDGITTIADLRRVAPDTLMKRYGTMGLRLHDLAHGRDTRRITPEQAIKSISGETTFETDIRDLAALEAHLWQLSVKVADRAKGTGAAGRVVSLKLKTAAFRTLSRQQALSAPTQLADTIFRTGQSLLRLAHPQGPFRLIGIGISDLTAASETDDAGGADLFDPTARIRAGAERASDAIRARFGAGSIIKGRGLSGPQKRP